MASDKCKRNNVSNSQQPRIYEKSLRLTFLPEVSVQLKVFTTLGDCMLWGWATSDPCKQVYIPRHVTPPTLNQLQIVHSSNQLTWFFYFQIKLWFSNFEWNYSILIETFEQIYFLFRIILNQVTLIDELQKQHFRGAPSDWYRHRSCYGFV